MKKFILFYLHILCAGLLLFYLGYPLGFILNELDIPIIVSLIILALYFGFAIKYYKVFVWINILPSIVAIIIAYENGDDYSILFTIVTIASLIIYSLSLLFSKKEDRL